MHEPSEYTKDLPTGPDCVVGVYGTLRNGFHRHNALGAGKKNLGSFGLKGAVMLHKPAGYPMLVMLPEGLEFMKSNMVPIEVYRIQTSEIPILDQIEGHPHLFQRKTFTNEHFGDVWIYTGNAEDELVGVVHIIPDNRWEGADTKFVEVDFGIRKYLADAKTRLWSKPKILARLKSMLPPPVDPTKPEEVCVNQMIVNNVDGTVLKIMNKSEMAARAQREKITEDEVAVRTVTLLPGRVIEGTVLTKKEETGTLSDDAIEPTKWEGGVRKDALGREIEWCYIEKKWKIKGKATSLQDVNKKIIADYMASVPPEEDIEIPKTPALNFADNASKVIVL